MNKIKTLFAAIVASLALIMGGVVTAAPAQAIWDTSVTVEGVPSGTNAWIRTTNMVGTDKIIHLNETARNVHYFCPASSGWELWIVGPAGTRRGLDPGQCYTPTNDGLYRVYIYYAD